MIRVYLHPLNQKYVVSKVNFKLIFIALKINLIIDKEYSITITIVRCTVHFSGYTSIHWKFISHEHATFIVTFTHQKHNDFLTLFNADASMPFKHAL